MGRHRATSGQTGRRRPLMSSGTVIGFYTYIKLTHVVVVVTSGSFDPPVPLRMLQAGLT